MRPLVSADVENVAVIPRRDHADVGTVVLDGDVGRDRGAVDDQVHVGRRNTPDFAEFLESFEDALRLILRCADDLMEEDAVVGLEHEVRVRSADVDTDSGHIRRYLFSRSGARPESGRSPRRAPPERRGIPERGPRAPHLRTWRRCRTGSTPTTPATRSPTASCTTMGRNPSAMASSVVWRTHPAMVTPVMITVSTPKERRNPAR